MTDEDECFLFDFGFDFVGVDDGCECEFGIWLFGPFFVMAEEEVGYSLDAETDFVDSVMVVRERGRVLVSVMQ